jgi:hypothetical protein
VSVSLMQYDEIHCDYHRGCPAFFQAVPIGCCYSGETRRQARDEGWETGVQQSRSPGSRVHLRRLDFCPAHAKATTGASS